METNVTTSYTTGTTINLCACDAIPFFENLAITTIAQCSEMESVEDVGILKSSTRLPHYDNLIEDYCSGVHGAVLSNMLLQNVKILYAFVQDCVLNGTVRGLYLMREKPQNGYPVYKLITLALREYAQLSEKEFLMLGKKVPYNFPEYCQYNEQFEKMFEQEG